jgi:hypothetical protein
MRKIVCVALIIASMGGCATLSQEAQVKEALNLPKEHFANTVSIKDGSLDTIATLTTVNGFQEKRGMLGIVWDDNFLRAFVNKSTGAKSFQVYQVIHYTGRGWHFYQSVNYETANGPKSKPVTVINRDVNCANSRYSGCSYTEHVAFDVDEEFLRDVAGRYVPGEPRVWGFKFNSRAGVDHTDGMLPAEIAGFLDRVDMYTNSKGFPTAAK